MDLLEKQNLLLMIRALYFSMDEHWSKLGRSFDLTPSQQLILFLLSTNNRSLTPTEISKLGCWHISTVTRLLRPLETKGYITISIDYKRPKYKNIELTDQGLEVLGKLVYSIKNMNDFPIDLSHLPKKVIIQFLETGQRILDAHKGEDFKLKVLKAKIEGVDYT